MLLKYNILYTGEYEEELMHLILNVFIEKIENRF